MKSIVNSIAVGGLFAALAMAQARYTLTDLGTLPGGNFSQASFVNTSGVVAGVSADAAGTQHAAFWLGSGNIVDITPGLTGLNSAAFGVNQLVQASVQAEIPTKDPNNENFCAYGTGLECRPFFWQAGMLFSLPLLGGNNGSVGVVNNRGQMAGYAENSTRDPNCAPGVSVAGTGPQVLDFEAVIWGPVLGQIKQLPPLPRDTVGIALGLNDYGQAVGTSGTCANTVLPPLAFGPHAVIWDTDGTVTDLGNLGGSVLNVAQSVNNEGQAVGFSSLNAQGTPAAFTHAFLWTRGTGMRDLGTLPGDAVSGGVSINDAGQVVGPSFDSEGNPRAFLWQNGTMIDLNNFIPANSPLYLLFASGINNRGEIVGFGATDSGEIHGFQLTTRQPLGSRVGLSAEPEEATAPKVLPEEVRRLVRQRLSAARLGARLPAQQ